MRSRLFHRPRLHSVAHSETKRITWIELFYDLIFVAAFIQLGNGLGHHASGAGVATFLAIFAPLWVAWTGFTFFENRFALDDFTHRLLVFGQMFAVGAMGLSAGDAMEGRPHAFSSAAALGQGFVVLMYVRAWIQVPQARRYSLYWGSVFLLAALAWGLGAFTPVGWTYGLWVVAASIVLFAPTSAVSRAMSAEWPVDLEHLSERYGLLTIIVLGESFVKVLGGIAERGPGLGLYAVACVILTITCCLWWIYFDDIGGSKIRGERGGWLVWFLGHLPLQVGLVALGVALSHAVFFAFDRPAPLTDRWLLAGSMALVFFSVALVDSATERRQAELSDRARVSARAFTGVLLILVAASGGTMSGATLLVLVMALCVAQVVFDLMMAPFENSQHDAAEERPVAALDRERVARRASGEARRERPRRDLSEALRRGAPSQLRRDLYSYLMDGSWLRVFVVLLFLYLAVNLLFAGLYVLLPGSIDGSRPTHFGDAFFFSVQTMSTIGYGAMSPGSVYGNVVVTAEAAAGILGAAIATGVMFAKASRPSTSVLFSAPMVISPMHGIPTLRFRAGNARGNEVVEGQISVTAVMLQVTPEGQHLRRLVDLPLVRSRTPLFSLSWTVMHPINEHSPLHGCDLADLGEAIFSFVVSFTGYDGTLAQNIHARHIYYPEDVRFGERFIDVISQLDDGRLLIDFTRFDHTEPAGDMNAEVLPSEAREAESAEAEAEAEDATAER